MFARFTFAMLVVFVVALGLVSACGKSSATTDTGCGASLPCTISTNVTN